MIGPQIPAHLLARKAEESDEEEEEEFGPYLPPAHKADEEAIAPALPPERVAKRRKNNEDEEQNPSSPSNSGVKRDNTIAGGENRKAGEEEAEEEEVYGPALPTATGKKIVATEAEQWAQLKAEDEKTRSSLGPEQSFPLPKEREEWMLVPPEPKASGSGSNFRSREMAKTDMSWTDVKGKTASRKKVDQSQPNPVDDEEDAGEMAAKVAAFDQHTRGKRSLMEIHMEEQQKKKDSGKSSKRISDWDRERDLVNNHKTVDPNSYVKRVGKLNDRFGAGSNARKFL